MENYESKRVVDDISRVDLVNDAIVSSAVRNVIQIHYTLTTKQREILGLAYPGYRLMSTRPIHEAQHPVLNASRQIDEHQIRDYVIAKYNPQGIILDIGGNPSRAQEYRRRVHCCNPILDQADVLRAASRPHRLPVTTCCHRAEDCQCYQFDIAISSHSLYYQTPEQISQVLIRTSTRILVASVHRVFDDFGMIGDDGWYVKKNGLVQFYANNSSYSYSHPSIDWLKTGGKIIGNKTLCWTYIQGNSMSIIICFKLHHGIVPLSQPNTILNPNDKNFYVKNYPLAWWWRLLGYSGPDLIISRVVVDKLKIWGALRKRDKDVLAQMSGEARRYYKELKVPEFVYSNSIPATVAEAYSSLGSSTGPLQEINDWAHTYNEYNNLLAGKINYSWWVRVLTGLAAGSAASLLVLTFVWKNIKKLVKNYPICSAFIPMLSYWIYKLKQIKLVNLPTVTDWMFQELYEQFKLAPTNTRLYYIDKPTRVRVFPPAMTMDQIMALPQNPASQIIIRKDIPEITIERPIVVYGIINTMVVMPGAFDRSKESYMAMLRNRMTKPPTTDRFSADLTAVWWCWHRMYTNQMFGDPGSARPIRQNEWIDKFPEHQQQFLHRAQEQNYYNITNGLYCRSIFMKREFYTKITHEGWVGKRPRPIQAGKAELHLKVACSVMGFQRHLKDYLHPRNYGNVHWFIPCGASPAEMGSVKDKHLNSNSCSEEGDDRDYDVHNGVAPQIMSAETIVTVCPTEDAQEVFEHLAHLGPTQGYVKDFIQVIIETWSIHSGDLWTYIVNCITNISRKTFILSLYQMRGKCLFCLIPVEGFYCAPCVTNFRTSWIRLFQHAIPVPQQLLPKLNSANDAMVGANAIGCFSGDDSDQMMDQQFAPPEDFYNRVSEHLGYDYKCKIHTGPYHQYHTSFCSGRWWPTNRGTILGPKLGRWICRSGWWIDPPKYTEDFLKQMLMGDCINRLMQCHFIPFLRLYWQKIRDLLDGVQPKLYTNRKYQDWIPNELIAEPCDETWIMLGQVYELTREHEEEYAKHLNTIHKLPAVFNFAPFAKALMIDCLDGDDKDDPLF